MNNVLLRLYALTKYNVFNATVAGLRNELKEDCAFIDARNHIFSEEGTYITLPATFEKIIAHQSKRLQ